MYDYATRLLENELSMLSSIVLDGNWEGYSEALRDRNEKINSLKKAINKIKS